MQGSGFIVFDTISSTATDIDVSYIDFALDVVNKANVSCCTH